MLCLGRSVSRLIGRRILRYAPVAGLLLAATTSYAADSPGVTFNSSVRYSQWAINSRTNDFYANTTKFGLATYNTDGSVINARNDSKNKLDYVPGLVAKSMIEAADYYQSFDWSKPWFLSVKEYGDTYYNSVPNAGGSLDNLNAVKLYIGIYNDKAYATDADKANAKTALGRAKAGLIAHNNTYSILSGTLAGDDVVGGWFHKTAYNNQMWLDGAYMGSALLAQLTNFYGNNSNVFGSKEADWDMVAKQLNIVWNMCWNSTDKLMYHAFEANAGTKETNSHAETWAGLSGTEPYVFHSAAYWGRANAWYLFALVDVLEAMKNDGQDNTTNYTTLKQHLTDLADGIKARQTTDGGWYQLLNKDDSFVATTYNNKSGNAANYIETSATTLFSAAFFKAARLGLLDASYKEVAKKAFELVVNNYTYLDANNNLEIWGSCKSAGLGGDGSNYAAGGSKFRDGSNEYYLLGNDVSMVKQADGLTEGKVLGGFIMAATEYERAYQNQDSKQILFARDLASVYDFSTTAGSLDATAYGDGTVAYQWYKDGVAISDATSATYTPTASGEYYCTATADGQTITTSKTNVTAKASAEGDKVDDTPTTTTSTVFSMTVNSAASASVDANSDLSMADYATINGGTVTLHNGKSTAQSMLANGTITYTDKGTQYVKIELTNALAKGDVIKLTTNGSKIYATKEPTSTTTNNVASEYTVGDELAGTTTLYLWSGDNKKTISAISITRTVQDVKYTVTATSDPTSNVSVAIKSGDTNIESGSKVSKGTALTFTASINSPFGSKYEFLGWTVNGTDIEGTDPTYTVASLDNDINVVAKFKRTKADVYFPVPSNGTSAATLGDKALKSNDEVDAGSQVTFTATPNEGYKFSYWEVYGDLSVALPNVTDNPYTVTIDHDYNLIAHFEKLPDPAAKTIVYSFTAGSGTTVGENVDGKNCTTSNDKLTFGSNFSSAEGKYITIKSNTGGFKAGDVITLHGYCDSKNQSGIVIYSDLTGESIFKTNELAKSTNGGSDYTFTLTEDCDNLYFGRFGGGSTYLTSLTIERLAATTKKRLTASFAENTKTVVNTTKTVNLPQLTVKDADGVLDAQYYAVSYASNAENVATVSGNVITLTGTPGIATITATITPTAETIFNGYEGCTATFQLTVQQPTPLGIEAMDISINANDAEVKQPIIKVYNAEDKELTLGTDYTLSFACSNDNVSVTGGVFAVKGTSRNWNEGETTITITATPSEALGETYTEGTLQFTYSVVKGLLKPVFGGGFAGKILKLNPKHKENSSDKSYKHSFIVPLVYDGEDVSDYFDYTFDVKGNDSSEKMNVSGNKLTYTHKVDNIQPTVTVSATPKVIKDSKGNVTSDYGDVYTTPDEITFTLDINSDYALIDVIVDPEEVSMYTGTAEGLPDITVKKQSDGSILDDDSYTVTWLTNMPNVVGVDNGRLLGRSEGDARVRILITGDGLESTTKFIIVTVDDPALYRAKSTETYGNQRVMWNQEKTISVTLGGWMFPNDVNKGVTPDNEHYFSSEGLSASYKWADNSSQAKWKMTGFQYYVPGDDSKNARNENASNSMPETSHIGNVDYSITKNIVDQMFNVPCSGSYLELNPKTNGRVDVHIFQNGVFDTSDGKYQYRPQRRVFVMDEAGNFVSSTPELENANGKPTGKHYTLSDYSWDMGSKETPTVDLVKSHFKGLDNFEMSAEGFQNGVYESNLSNEVAPNEAAQNDPSRKGVNGWCVLADSPVTYSFDVKAGKTYYLYNFGSKIGFYGFSFEETKPVVDEIVYDDQATNNEVKATEPGHVAKVKINLARPMLANTWTTCVLPFSLTKPQVDAIFGKTYCTGNEQGTQILYFDRIEGNKVWFVRHAYNTIVAGKPFLIKPTKEVSSINTADCEDFPYVTIENEQPADWCKSNGYVWKSSYNKDLTVKTGDGFIGYKDGKLYTFTDETPATLPGGFRGYLQANITSDAKPQILSVGMGSNIDSDGSTTFIGGLTMEADGSYSATMAEDGKVYNVSGQLVGNGKSLNTLPTGVYVVNGKKYVK